MLFPSFSFIFCGVFKTSAEGDLYEDGLALRNGFFRSRKFVPQSEGSLDLFAEERREESGGEEGEVEVEVEDTQMEALRRRDRLEREEYMKKCRVGSELILQDTPPSLVLFVPSPGEGFQWSPGRGQSEYSQHHPRHHFYPLQ